MYYDPKQAESPLMPSLNKNNGNSQIRQAPSSSTNNNPVRQATMPQGSLLENIAYYFFLGTIILAPIMFWANPYVPQDIVKTFIIAIGTLVSVILFGFVAVKEHRLALPSKSMVWLSILMAASLITSAFMSIHAGKSFFGQGFEIGTVSFILILFLSALVAFTVVSRRPDRVIVAYVGMFASFIILYLFQLLRLFFGPDFMSLAVFNSVTSSLIGGWYNLSSFAIVVAIISLVAIAFLRLSSRMKIIYWIFLVLSAAGAIVVNDFRLWLISAIVFLGLAIYFPFAKGRSAGGATLPFFKRIAWMPLIACLLSVLFFYQGSGIAGPVIQKYNAGHAELSLPWQMTLDVTASAIKNYPLFGIGPNHFAQAFLAYKPAGINQTNVWGTEFANGFGLLPTFAATQGIVGIVLWILFFVFFGLLGARVLARLPQGDDTRFFLVSSYASSAFLWLMAVISVPAHAIMLYAFVLTGVFLGVAVSSGALATNTLAPLQGSGKQKAFSFIMVILVLVSVVWGFVYIKKLAAFSYFAGGVKQLTVSGNAEAADVAFSKALSFDTSDVYWQARTEAVLAEAQKLAATVTATSTAADSAAVAKQIGDILNTGIKYAENAIAYDPTNYYNYLSEARVSEAAAGINMANAYDNAVKAYTNAANLNPYNPSIYLSLANLQANNKKLDDALRTTGVALQVKNNYLDAVFLLSQIYAAKGDLPNAITAAKIATQLNPENAMLFFQLGILGYNDRDYAGAAAALKQAVDIQPDYSNAKYFLGLSLVRLGSTTPAIMQFEDLARMNPDNQEIGLILANLKAGKPIFNDAKPPVTTAPEKRAKLPIKEDK
jgi:tetratricopeptide (TPR) repeat protein